MSSISTYAPTASSRLSGPAVFVSGVWLVMLVGAFNFLARFAVNVPYAEDGMLIPYITGNESFSWNFFWCQYSNHVIPLPKLTLILTARFTHDFRTAMYLSVAACAAAALVLTFAARTLRGHFNYSDAFFSFGLLHLGHWESYLLGFAIQEVMATCLLAVILWTLLRVKTTLSHSHFIIILLCLLLLPLTGASGFLIAPFLLGWLAYSTWLRWREEGGAYSFSLFFRIVLLLAALLPLLPYVLVSQEGVSWRYGSPSLGEKLAVIFSVFLQVLTLGFGSSAATSWLPFLNQQRACYLVGSSICGLVVVGVVVFLRQRSPEERLRKSGLICFLLANFIVAGAIAAGRSGASATIGLSPRYSLYAIPLLWALYFCWELYGSALGRQLVPLGLFAFMCAMTSQNMNMGYTSGEGRHAVLKILERDLVRPEVPAIDIATTYGKYVSCGHWVYYKLRQIGGDEHVRFAEMVEMLRRANIPRRKFPAASP